jgi:hypothetical protein
LQLQRTRNAELIQELIDDSKLKRLYERNPKTLFQVTIGFRPYYIDSNELETILRSSKKDERDLYDALIGLAR